MNAAFPPQIPDGEDWEIVLDVYERFKPLMYAVALKYAPEEAEDLMQESLVRLRDAAEKLRGLDERRLGAYAATVVEHTALNYIKRGNVRRRWRARDDMDVAGVRDDAPTPEELLLATERTEAFYRCFSALPEDDQLLLKGKYFLELSDEELAARFGCKPASVRMKLTRARRRALELFREREYFNEHQK